MADIRSQICVPTRRATRILLRHISRWLGSHYNVVNNSYLGSALDKIANRPLLTVSRCERLQRTD
jgi:hypothetical protein